MSPDLRHGGKREKEEKGEIGNGRKRKREKVRSQREKVTERKYREEVAKILERNDRMTEEKRW